MNKISNKTFTVQKGDCPIVATAIHNGHHIREELQPFLAIEESARLREEDPFTGLWTEIVENRIVFSTSRFEVDVNRPRERAIYRTPADAWGLQIWNKDLPENIVENSLVEYDNFYAHMFRLFSELEEKYGKFVVMDLHSFNYRRSGPNGKPDDPKLNPDVNIGTVTMPRKYWGDLVDRFIRDLQKFDFREKNLDVRENVNFPGGRFMRWVHKNFPNSGCAIAIEFKKIFMDEWTGIPNEQLLNWIKSVLSATIPGIKEELAKMRD